LPANVSALAPVTPRVMAVAPPPVAWMVPPPATVRLPLLVAEMTAPAPEELTVPLFVSEPPLARFSGMLPFALSIDPLVILRFLLEVTRVVLLVRFPFTVSRLLLPAVREREPPEVLPVVVKFPLSVTVSEPPTVEAVSVAELLSLIVAAPVVEALKEPALVLVMLMLPEPEDSARVLAEIALPVAA